MAATAVAMGGKPRDVRGIEKLQDCDDSIQNGWSGKWGGIGVARHNSRSTSSRVRIGAVTWMTRAPSASTSTRETRPSLPAGSGAPGGALAHCMSVSYRSENSGPVSKYFCTAARRERARYRRAATASTRPPTRSSAAAPMIPPIMTPLSPVLPASSAAPYAAFAPRGGRGVGGRIAAVTVGDVARVTDTDGVTPSAVEVVIAAVVPGAVTPVAVRVGVAFSECDHVSLRWSPAAALLLVNDVGSVVVGGKMLSDARRELDADSLRDHNLDLLPLFVSSKLRVAVLVSVRVGNTGHVRDSMGLVVPALRDEVSLGVGVSRERERVRDEDSVCDDVGTVMRFDAVSERVGVVVHVPDREAVRVTVRVMRS
jgi:hypothetical protein